MPPFVYPGASPMCGIVVWPVGKLACAVRSSDVYQGRSTDSSEELPSLPSQGEAGPFSMLTYEQTRPWAMAMKLDVQTGKMPPCLLMLATANLQRYESQPSEIETLAKVGRCRRAEGRSQGHASADRMGGGLGIGKPDLVYELPVPFDVPASGVIDYQHVIVPTGFTEDRWIQAGRSPPYRAHDRSSHHRLRS